MKKLAFLVLAVSFSLSSFATQKGHIFYTKKDITLNTKNNSQIGLSDLNKKFDCYLYADTKGQDISLPAGSEVIQGESMREVQHQYGVFPVADGRVELKSKDQDVTFTIACYGPEHLLHASKPNIRKMIELFFDN